MSCLKQDKLSLKSILLFILKLWIFTNLFSAFLNLIFSVVAVDGVWKPDLLWDAHFWKALSFMFFLGLFFSVPAMLLLGFIIKLGAKKRPVLACISVLLVIVTFYFIGFWDLKNTRAAIPSQALVYCVMMLILIFLLPFKSKTEVD